MWNVMGCPRSPLSASAVVLAIGTVGLLGWFAFPLSAQTAEAGRNFTDVTKQSGLEDLYQRLGRNYWGSGLHLADLDGDGHLDFYMSAHGRGKGQALLNDGKGHFKPAEGEVPTTEIHMVYDINEDGKADLSVNWDDGGAQWWINQSEPGRLKFVLTKDSRTCNLARQNVLVDINRDGKVDWLRGAKPGVWFDLGDGTGRFAVGESMTVAGSDRAEQSVMAADFDGDGFMDLAVEWGRYTSPRGKSRLYRNDGKGTFVDVTDEVGLKVDDFSIKGIGDFNQDGWTDLLVLEEMRLVLFLNDGKGHFVKKQDALKNIKGPRATYASWGIAVMVDLDNDGVADIMVNGKHFLKIFRGEGDGTFTYINDVWGIRDYAKSAVDEGLCFGDVDSDGMLDVLGYVRGPERGNWNAPFAVYHNDLPKLNWVRVRPVGLPGNRGAAGAKIRLYEPGGLGDAGKLIWYDQVSILNRQSSQSCYGLPQTERHFGLGKRETVDVSVEFYPSGKKVQATGVRANRIVLIEEETGKTTQQVLARPK